ncbi:MAG: ROK family protein, partial [Opitutaceae bacterium]|nr:ROK family protein [Verrucomicrobiales bacterium]
MTYFLGIDLGGSSVKAVAITPSGQILRQEHFVFDAKQPMAWAAGVNDVIQQFETALKHPASGLGLSAPGIVARDGRSIAHMPGRLQGLEGLIWSDFLKRADLVPVLNDAQAALLGESSTGAARGFADVILLTLGTG